LRAPALPSASGATLSYANVPIKARHCLFVNLDRVCGTGPWRQVWRIVLRPGRAEPGGIAELLRCGG